MVHRDPVEVRAVFSPGSEMLICVYYHPRLKMYYQTGYQSRYFRGTDGWLSGPTPVDEHVFPDLALRELIQETAIETVATNAELVVEGVIESVITSKANGPDGSSGQLVTLLLNVEAVKKGHLVANPIKIVAITRGIYWPEWRRTVPKSYAVGQRWLCFLRLNDQGWYPFAGSDGLFQVVDDKLVYAERVEYWESKLRVEKVIESVRYEVGQ
jgi:hypothetical protein